VTRVRLTGDPADWSVVRRITFVCLMPEGEVALTPSRALPSDWLRPDEHPLDACLRIPLAAAGFRYQHFHPFALDDDHLYAWVEGDRYHQPPVEPVVGRPKDPDAAALVDEAIADHELLPAETYYAENIRTLQRAYLMAATPEGQSGFGRDEAAWRQGRLEVADAVDRAGTFLDVGCANGYLAECVDAWCAERGLSVEPYGIDIAPGLVELAQRRLPGWADRFWVGNAIDWVHPEGRRFDFVHTLLDVVPVRLSRPLLDHQLASIVAPGGRLIVSQYSTRAGERTDDRLRSPGLGVDRRPMRIHLDFAAVAFTETWLTAVETVGLAD
jgi:2-polyprenyl-3-methyl-5-hydroxy-6-metoxy-1,4-benzoquinol methylase